MGPLKLRKVQSESGDVEKEEKLKIIDVAGGTGDISFRILNKARKDSLACNKHSFLILSYRIIC